MSIGEERAVFLVSLRERRIIVAPNHEVIDSTGTGEVDELFDSGKIFRAASEPVVEIFRGDRFFERGELSFFSGGEPVGFGFVDERGVIVNIFAVLGVVFGLFNVALGADVGRAHKRAENVEFERGIFFAQIFETFDAGGKNFGGNFVLAGRNQAAVKHGIRGNNSRVSIRCIFLKPAPKFVGMGIGAVQSQKFFRRRQNFVARLLDNFRRLLERNRSVVVRHEQNFRARRFRKIHQHYQNHQRR